MTAIPTQSEIDQINAAIAASGAERVKKTTKAALDAFGRGEFTADATAAWLTKQKATQPELFMPKAASNPFEDETPGGEKRRIDFIRTKGARAAASLCNSVGRDLAGRQLRRAG